MQTGVELKFTKKWRFVYFLVSLLVLLFLLHQGRQVGVLYVIVFISVSTVLGIYAVSGSRRDFWIATLLGIPVVLFRWGSLVVKNELVTILMFISSIVFFLFLTVSILLYVLRSREVTTDTLFGAISVYLLIGFTWALGYALLNLIQPDSFALSTQSKVSDEAATVNFIYYSYTTLTTLGYGDITPKSSIAKYVAVMEAVCGVLYVAILVARLVGLHLVPSPTKKSD